MASVSGGYAQGIGPLGRNQPIGHRVLKSKNSPSSMDRGQLEEAVRYYRMAIDSGPENSKLQKDYEDALRRLKK